MRSKKLEDRDFLREWSWDGGRAQVTGSAIIGLCGRKSILEVGGKRWTGRKSGCGPHARGVICMLSTRQGTDQPRKRGWSPAQTTEKRRGREVSRGRGEGGEC